MNFTGAGGPSSASNRRISFDHQSPDTDPNSREDHDDASDRNNDGGDVHCYSLRWVRRLQPLDSRVRRQDMKMIICRAKQQDCSEKDSSPSQIALSVEAYRARMPGRALRGRSDKLQQRRTTTGLVSIRSQQSALLRGPESESGQEGTPGRL